MKKQGFLRRTMGVVVILAIALFAASSAKGELKSTTLKFASWMPERHETSVHARWWSEQVTKRTDGRIQFQFFYGGALGKGKDQLDNIKYGTFDLGPILPAYDPAKSPLWTIPYIPWAILDPWVRIMAQRELAELPVMKEELAKWDAMFLFPFGMGDVYYLWTVKKPIYSLGDIKGLKIRSLGEMAQSLAAIGASPVSMPMPDVYDALSKGIIEGGCFATAPIMGYKLYEVCKYKSTMTLGMGGPIWVMKKSVFNKLPDDIQKVIMEVSLEMAKHMAEREVEFLKEADNTFEKAGVTVIEFPEGDQTKYEEVGVMPVVEKWIKDKETKGLPGRKVWENLRNASLKHKKIPH